MLIGYVGILYDDDLEIPYFWTNSLTKAPLALSRLSCSISYMIGGHKRMDAIADHRLKETASGSVNYQKSV